MKLFFKKLSLKRKVFKNFFCVVEGGVGDGVRHGGKNEKKIISSTRSLLKMSNRVTIARIITQWDLVL